MFKNLALSMGKALALCFILSAPTSIAKAENTIMIGETAIRATAGNMTATGGYVTIVNHGAIDDRLIGVSADFAQRSELHTMEHVDGVMKMREMPNGAPLPAGGELILKPGGMHLMFMGVDHALAPGTMKSVTLHFENAGEMTVKAHVKKPADLKHLMDESHAGHAGDHDDHTKKHSH